MSRSIRYMFLNLLFITVLSACGVAASSDTTAHLVSTTESTLPPLLLPTPMLALPTSLPKNTQPITTFPQGWLHGQPCQAPCWEGITPGVTPVADAVEILNRHPFVLRMELNLRVASWEDDSLTWFWNGMGGGTIGFPPQISKPTVSWIRINTPQIYSMSSIIDAYGEPSHIVPIFGISAVPHTNVTSRYFDLKLIYLKQGFYLETERYIGEPPVISRDMNLSGKITFFPSSTMGIDEVLHNNLGLKWSSDDLIPWQGFQDFATYCRLVRSSQDSQQQCPNLNK